MSPTRAMTRAWEIWWPRTTSVTSSSSIDGGRANERYCAVAQMHGRPVSCFHHLDARAEPASAEQRAGARGEPAHDLHVPARAVGRVGFETEERPGVHRPGTTVARPGRLQAALRSTRPACIVSFMPVSVRSVCCMRQASMRCAYSRTVAAYAGSAATLRICAGSSSRSKKIDGNAGIAGELHVLAVVVAQHRERAFLQREAERLFDERAVGIAEVELEVRFLAPVVGRLAVAATA